MWEHFQAVRHKWGRISMCGDPSRMALCCFKHNNPEKHQMRFVQVQKGKCDERASFPWQELKTWAKENTFSPSVGDDT